MFNCLNVQFKGEAIRSLYTGEIFSDVIVTVYVGKNTTLYLRICIYKYWRDKYTYK